MCTTPSPSKNQNTSTNIGPINERIQRKIIINVTNRCIHVNLWKLITRQTLNIDFVVPGKIAHNVGRNACVDSRVSHHRQGDFERCWCDAVMRVGIRDDTPILEPGDGRRGVTVYLTGQWDRVVEGDIIAGVPTGDGCWRYCHKRKKDRQTCRYIMVPLYRNCMSESY